MDFCKLIPTSKTMWVMNKCQLCAVLYIGSGIGHVKLSSLSGNTTLFYYLYFKSSKISGYLV